MKRFLALGIVAACIVPALAFAQSVPLVTVSAPQGGQPQGAALTPGANVPVVAVSVMAGGSPVTITALSLRSVGSAGDGAVSNITVVDTTNATLGTAGGFSSGSATVPVSVSLGVGERKTLVVFVTTASDLAAYQNKFLNINIQGITTSAVVSGALPMYGAQFSLSSGVNKPTCQISANPSTYAPGQTVTLIWASTDASGGTITGLGSVGPQGQQGILPGGSGTYTGTFTGPGGTGTCSIPVIFNPATGGGIFGPGTVGTGAGTFLNTCPSGGTLSGSNCFLSNGTVVPATPVPNPGSGTTVMPGVGTGSTGTGVSQVCNGLDCQICSAASLLQKVVNFFIGLSIPIAAVMFAWAGILYFTSAANPTGIEKAKSRFKYAFVGFLIAVTAWLIIQTIVYFVATPAQYQNWNKLQCNTTPRIGTVLGQNGNTTNFGQVLNSTTGTPNTNTPVPLAVGGSYSGGVPTYSCPAGYDLIGTTCTSRTTGDTINATVTTGGIVNQNFNGGGCAGLSAAAACVATYESSCNPLIGSGVDLGADRNPVSWGCLQINISANQVNGLNCPAAFGGGAYTSRNHGTYVVDQSLYTQCVNAAQNSCNQATFDYYSKNGSTLTPWGTKARANCGGL